MQEVVAHTVSLRLRQGHNQAEPMRNSFMLGANHHRAIIWRFLTTKLRPGKMVILMPSQFLCTTQAGLACFWKYGKLRSRFRML